MGDPHNVLEDTELECIDTTEMTGFFQVTSMDSDFKAHIAEQLPSLVDKQKQSGKPILAKMKKMADFGTFVRWTEESWA